MEDLVDGGKAVYNAAVTGLSNFFSRITDKVVGADTGMYTGTVDDAKLAFLHEKELVLNASDTENILSAVGMIRSIPDDVFASIGRALSGEGLAAMALMGQRLSVPSVSAAGPADFNQTLTISEVNFPNVTSSREIVEAFENLTNDAAQWVMRRKS